MVETRTMFTNTGVGNNALSIELTVFRLQVVTVSMTMQTVTLFVTLKTVRQGAIPPC